MKFIGRPCCKTTNTSAAPMSVTHSRRNFRRTVTLVSTPVAAKARRPSMLLNDPVPDCMACRLLSWRRRSSRPLSILETCRLALAGSSALCSVGRSTPSRCACNLRASVFFSANSNSLACLSVQKSSTSRPSSPVRAPACPGCGRRRWRKKLASVTPSAGRATVERPLWE